MIKGLRLRLALVCSAATVLVLAGICFSALRISEGRIHLQAEQAFTSNLNAISYSLRGQLVLDNNWLLNTEAAEDLLIRVYSGDRPILFTSYDERRNRLTGLAYDLALREGHMEALVAPGSLRNHIVQFPAELEGSSCFIGVCRIPVQDGPPLEVTVVKPRAKELNQVLELRLSFAVYVVAGAAFLCLFAWFFTKWSVRPVEESGKRQAEFISAASHELRSPLAVMQASADALVGAAPDEVKRLSQNIRGECGRLSRLTKDLLSLAGAGDGRWQAVFRPTEPETLLLTVMERFDIACAQKGVGLTADLPQARMRKWPCDPDRMEQLLFILVDNALSYTPEGGNIVVSAKEAGRWLRFLVSDTGPGVADQDKKKIFDRFYRADAARTDREHYGLGLSIAREIARMHKGKLTVEDRPGGGAVFILAIPR